MHFFTGWLPTFEALIPASISAYKESPPPIRPISNQQWNPASSSLFFSNLTVSWWSHWYEMNTSGRTAGSDMMFTFPGKEKDEYSERFIPEIGKAMSCPAVCNACVRGTHVPPSHRKPWDIDWIGNVRSLAKFKHFSNSHTMTED